MIFRRLQIMIFAGLFGVSLMGHSQSQSQAMPGEKVKRQQAMQLFDQGKRLEALPLLEELARNNPADSEVVVALAASLVSHAATVTDIRGSRSERLRAKALLEKSGSRSALAGNLLQLLREMPDSGEIQFSQNPAVEQAMLAGEAAFSRRDFDEAIKNYSRALEVDPVNYPATLFVGNSFDKKDDFNKAREWYEKAIQLNRDIETAFRYYAHMLVRQNDMAQARMMLIHAAVAEPYNRLVWRDLHAWAAINGTRLNLAFAGITPDEKGSEPSFKVLRLPQSPKMKVESNEFNLLNAGVLPGLNSAHFSAQPGNLSDVKTAYEAVRSDWKQGGRFKQRFGGKDYRHSLAEETDALTAECEVLEKLRSNIDTAELITEDQPLRLLLQLHQAGLLEPYVLFRLADEGIAHDYSAYRERNRKKLEQYLDQFVVPQGSHGVH